MFEERLELPDDKVAELTELAELLVSQRSLIELCEEELAEHKEKEKRLSQEIIPNKMLSLNLTMFALANGKKIEIKHKFVGSIPKSDDLRQRAFDWLIDNNLEDIIKNEIRCDFKKGEKELADKVVEAISSLGVTYSRKKDVHHQTLKATAKDLIKRGQNVPLDTLGLIEIDETEITK